MGRPGGRLNLPGSARLVSWSPERGDPGELNILERLQMPEVRTVGSICSASAPIEPDGAAWWPRGSAPEPRTDSRGGGSSVPPAATH